LEGFVFRQVRSEADLEQAQSIRKAVFVREQGIPEEMEYDEYDTLDALETRVVHILAWKERSAAVETAGGLPAVGTAPAGNPSAVATGRLILKGAGVGTLSRIAVLKQYRGRGLGKAVVQKLEEQARELGLSYLSLQPHTYLEEFYGKLGYTPLPGAHSSVAGHPLITMEKWL